MLRDIHDQKPMLSKYAMESEMERLTKCANPLCENVLCRCVDGFASKAERDHFTREETKQSIRTDFHRLRNLVGERDAKRFIANLVQLPF